MASRRMWGSRGLVPPTIQLLALLLAGPTAAWAQSSFAFGDGSVRILSSGPVVLAEGQRLQMGLLLPAVQQLRARVRFLDAAGQDGHVLDLAPPAGASSFFDVFVELELQKEMFLVRDPLSRQLLTQFPAPNGVIAILIGLLLPAVQSSSDPFQHAYGASLRLFDAQGQAAGILPFLEQRALFRR